MRTRSANLKDHMYSWLLLEMQEAESAGVAFHVDGEKYCLGQEEELRMVMEDYYYMKSYEEDDKGYIRRIDFEHIESV